MLYIDEIRDTKESNKADPDLMSAISPRQNRVILQFHDFIN